MRPRIFITRKLPEKALKILKEQCQCGIWPKEDTPVSKEALRDSVGDIEGLLCLLTDRIDEQILDLAPKLKIVSNMAAGYDNIDVNACKKRNIMVTNTPGVLTETTADLAFALLMASARRIPEAYNDLLQGGWQTWSPMYMAGRDIYGATLGIVGLGRIGKALAVRARGFSMRILYWNRVRKQQLEEELGLEYMELDQLLSEADYLSLHVPLNDETRGLIGERELNLMKKTAILINTARGPVVDSQALYKALASGTIWGAGLDVFDYEPVNPGEPLIRLKNVVALPHIGSASADTRTKMAVMAAENLLAGLQGGIPENLVI